jgi:hypothetical protein
MDSAMNLFSRKQALWGMCLLLVLVVCSCKEKVTEPTIEGRFYLQNNTGLTLKVQAKDGNDFVVLKNSQIAPNAKEELVTIPELSPTNVFPTTVFTEFRVYVNTGLKDSTLYSGVTNNDWTDGVETDEYKELILAIPN